jgi:hypothetical protein
MMHDMYLVEVKSCPESRGPSDYYKVLADIPAERVFAPLSESACPRLTASPETADRRGAGSRACLLAKPTLASHFICLYRHFNSLLQLSGKEFAVGSGPFRRAPIGAPYP